MRFYVRRYQPGLFWVTLISLLVLGLVLMMAGCAFFPPPFDPVEYDHLVRGIDFVELTAKACPYPGPASGYAGEAEIEIRLFARYSKPLAGEASIADAGAHLQKLAEEMNARLSGPYLQAYCQQKTSELKAAAEALQAELGKRTR